MTPGRAGVTGQTQATGRMMEKGVRPAYLSMPYGPYVDGLKERGIEIVEEEEWD